MNKITLALTTLLIFPSLSQSCELNEKQVNCLQFIAAHGPDNDKRRDILKLELGPVEVMFLHKRDVTKALRASHLIMQSRAEGLPDITTFRDVAEKLQKKDLIGLLTALSEGKKYKVKGEGKCLIQ